MKPVIISSFTETGSELNRVIRKRLLQDGISCKSYMPEQFIGYAEQEAHAFPVDIHRWIGENWGKVSFLFIGALGIAVRYSAPWIQDKYKDSAVVVMDERGRFSIPVLSGHMGRAIELAEQIAMYTNGVPVITTATDIQGKFAVDVFARENELHITDRRLAKKISAGILSGEQIGFYSESEVAGMCPEEVKQCDTWDQLAQFPFGVAILNRAARSDQTRSNTLCLLKKNIVVGIGCKKDVAKDQIAQELSVILQRNQTLQEQICAFASIDRKQEEAGIIALAQDLQVPFQTYSAQELASVQRVSSHSAFVEQTVGVDNVCERAAILAGDHGTLLQPKTCGKETAFSLVAKRQQITFDRGTKND